MSGISLSLPFYAEGSAPASSVLPLFAEGAAHTLCASLDLVAWNSQSGVYDSVPFYARGLGWNDGYGPFSATLPLFAQRGEAAQIPLYAHGPGTPTSSGLPFYSSGSSPFSSGLPMYASGLGVSSGSISLFARGF